MFTGNKDVDFLILNQLEDHDLVKISQINKYMNSLCQDECFWINRIEQVFKINSETRIKSKAFFEFNTWKELYIYFAREYYNGVFLDDLDLYISCQPEIESLTNLITYPNWIIPEIFKREVKRNNLYLIERSWRGMENFLYTFAEHLLDVNLVNSKIQEYISKVETLEK